MHTPAGDKYDRERYTRILKENNADSLRELAQLLQEEAGYYLALADCFEPPHDDGSYTPEELERERTALCQSQGIARFA